MDAVMQWMGDQDVLEFVLAIAAAAWTLFRAKAAQSEWAGRIKDTEFERALTALAAAVHKTGTEFGDALRAAAQDGVLSPSEYKQLEERMRANAIEIARENGVDLGKVLGSGALRYYLDVLDQWRLSPAGTSLGVTLPHSGEEVKVPAMKI